MATRVIECDSCDFTGKLIYTEGDFTKADISYCPACGGDITEEYNTTDEQDDDI